MANNYNYQCHGILTFLVSIELLIHCPVDVQRYWKRHFLESLVRLTNNPIKLIVPLHPDVIVVIIVTFCVAIHRRL